MRQGPFTIGDPRSAICLRAGATLVEMLMVIMILGVMSMIVVPSLLQPGQMDIQAAARQVISDILVAQNDAVGAAAVRRVQFNAAAGSYRTTDAQGKQVNHTWSSEVVLGRDMRFQNVRIEAVDFGGNDYLEFDELGGTSTGGTLDLVSPGHRYRVSVKPFTGRVTVAPVP